MVWCDGTGGSRPTSPISTTCRIHQTAYLFHFNTIVQARPYAQGIGACPAPASPPSHAQRLAKFASLAGVWVSWVMMASARRERRRLPLHLWVMPRGTNASMKRQDRKWMHKSSRGCHAAFRGVSLRGTRDLLFYENLQTRDTTILVSSRTISTVLL